MKTAKFKYQGPDANQPATRPNVTIFGSIKLKDDGKVSITIHEKNRYSYGNLYAAKLYANAIIDSNFTTGNFYDLVDTRNSESLVGILTEKTQDLRATYIERTKAYAKLYFERAKRKFAQPVEEWYKEYNVKYEYVPQNNYGNDKMQKMILTPIKTEYNKKGLYKMRRAISNNYDLIQKIGFEKFEEKEIIHAENHYSNSVAKLAFRLGEKGVTLGNMKIQTAELKMNFEITIDCDGIITRAWTIIAEGQIQRPHYRYLVK